MKGGNKKMDEQATLFTDNPEYDAFVDKFKPKKTTDDCYTPENVYNAVADWVSEEYQIDRARFVRPFWPGGDYQAFDYPADCVVVDNPPFSIITKIVIWYLEKNVRFFLFAPSLTIFSATHHGCCALITGANIIYENGAKINTSFATNLENNVFRTSSQLRKILSEVQNYNSRTVAKHIYPDCVITSAMLDRYAKLDIEFSCSQNEAQWAGNALDSQISYGMKMFGSGFFISERAAAERAAAERAAAHKWELSEREWGIVKSLGGNQEGAAQCNTLHTQNIKTTVAPSPKPTSPCPSSAPENALTT